MLPKHAPVPPTPEHAPLPLRPPSQARDAIKKEQPDLTMTGLAKVMGEQ